jgi:hypothetical protein
MVAADAIAAPMTMSSVCSRNVPPLGTVSYDTVRPAMVAALASMEDFGHTAS